MTRLSEATRTRLSAEVEQPAYERTACATGIVHLGIGAFHRAHQAVYTDRLLDREGGDWRIAAVSLRSSSVRDALAPQDDLYTVQVCGPCGTRRRLVGALAKVLVAPEDPSAVVQALSDPRIGVVTLTVTEKGYGRSAATGRLDDSRPEVAADLAGVWPPATALGYLRAALEHRRRSGAPGLTLMSCDNLAANGRALEAAVLALCQARSDGLADWVGRHCRFPCTMVDRIVPASSPAQLDPLEQLMGVADAAAVFTEPFSQWVIERRFATAVPRWDTVGAEFVEDVAPFEDLKLRLLNASHSMLAWFGGVTGHALIAEAIARPPLAGLVARYLKTEAQPTLLVPPGYRVEQYCDQLLRRFANPGLPHRCAQIAADSSQKLAQRLLPVLRWNLARGGATRCTTLAIAAWLRYTRGVDENGRAYTIDDPLADAITDLQCRRSTAAKLAALPSVFGTLFEEHPEATAEIDEWLADFDRHGVLAAAASLNPSQAP